MAIQMRRGAYLDFDPSRMLPGELAVVLSGDDTTDTGKGIYICFSAGDVQRLSTYEEIVREINDAMADAPEMAEMVTNAVNAALIAHPEWTTTVQDGAVTVAKLNSNVTAFTEASTRSNIASGDSITTLWGKIKKWFTDLKAVAFSGAYSDLTGKPTLGDAASKSVANNLTTASAGSAVLDAYQGKVLEDELHPAYANKVVPTMATNVSLYRNNCYRLGNFIMINMVLRVYATIPNGGNLCNFSGVTVSSSQDIPMMQASTGKCYAAAFQAGTGNLNANGDLLGSENGIFYFINGSLYAPLSS